MFPITTTILIIITVNIIITFIITTTTSDCTENGTKTIINIPFIIKIEVTKFKSKIILCGQVINN